MVTGKHSWLVRTASDSHVRQGKRIVASCLRGIVCCSVTVFLLGCMNVWVPISFSAVNYMVQNFILKRLNFSPRRMRSGCTCLSLATVYYLFTRRKCNNSHVAVTLFLSSVNRNASWTMKPILPRRFATYHDTTVCHLVVSRILQFWNNLGSTFLNLLLYLSPLHSTYEIPGVEYLEGPTHLNVRQRGSEFCLLVVATSHWFIILWTQGGAVVVNLTSNCVRHCTDCVEAGR